MQTKTSRTTQVLLWVAIIVAPLASMLVIGLATGTNVFAIDAWNTAWNDERHYFWTVQQMHLFGSPEGVAGYNEVTAARPSYGPYSVVTYIPYYLGAFFTGVGSHNFMYVINVALGILTAGVVVLVLRPDVRQSLYCIVFFLTQFIVERYVCSGMTEASYVLFAGIVGSCTVWVALKGGSSAHWKVVCAIVVTIAAVGLWGAMRPFLLAFIIVPCALLVWGETGLSRAARVVLVLLAAVVSAIALASYLYVAKYYATPYFGDSSTLDLLSSLISGGIGEFVRLHGHFVLTVGKSFVTMHWAGIVTFLFACAWIILLIAAIRLKQERAALLTHGRANDRGKQTGESGRGALVLVIALLVVGALVFEANILLYSASRIHRMLIAVDIVYVLAIVWIAASRIRNGKVTWRFVNQAAITLLCCASLIVVPGSFVYPQVDAALEAEEVAGQQALAEAMPRADDAWDNTVSHPVESDGLQVYFCLPPYMNLNGCTKDYVEKAIKNDSLSAKYLSLPEGSSLNKAAKKKYEIVYEGLQHVIYRVR